MPVARAIPIDQIYNPLILCSIKPNTCSTLALVFDFVLFVFFPGIALARNFRKTGIYNFPFVEYLTFIIQVNRELVEQVFNNAHLCEFLTKQPDGLFIGSFIACFKAQKILKTIYVNNLVFHLMVSKF